MTSTVAPAGFHEGVGDLGEIAPLIDGRTARRA